MELKGYLIDIQNYSVNDGEGIRTVLFFAGCPLRCQWCSNPESHTTLNKVFYLAHHCIHCGKCVSICPQGVGIDLADAANRKKCKHCGRCVDVCPTKSRKNTIYTYSLEEVQAILERQMIFFRHSQGGVTYSGGEATSQPEFLQALVHAQYDHGMNQALETSGYFDFDALKETLPLLDLIFFDIKHMQDALHRKFTGVSNRLILDNLKRVASLGVDIVARVPVIEGVNADLDNLRATAHFLLKHVSNPTIELLAFHRYGDEKYDSLAMRKPSSSFQTPHPEHLLMMEETLRRMGVEVISFR